MILIPTSRRRMNERVEINYKRYAHPVILFRPLYFQWIGKSGFLNVIISRVNWLTGSENFFKYKAVIAVRYMLSGIVGSQPIKYEYKPGFESCNKVIETSDVKSQDFKINFYIGGKSPRRTSRLNCSISGWEDSSGGLKARPVLSSVFFRNFFSQSQILFSHKKRVKQLWKNLSNIL